MNLRPDPVLREVLMLAVFTIIGLNASVLVIRRCGLQLVVLLALGTAGDAGLAPSMDARAGSTLMTHVVVISVAIGLGSLVSSGIKRAEVVLPGFCGFILGITANALATMGEVTERFGPSPRAFVVVPVVSAFLIDLTNALVITTMANLVR